MQDVFAYKIDDLSKSAGEYQPYTTAKYKGSQFANFVSHSQPPVLAAIDPKSIDEGDLLSFAATATDPDTLQELTYSLVSPPQGAAIDASTGLFTWTPTDGTAGSVFTITVKVTDDGTPELSNTKNFTVTVRNKKPVADLAGPTNVLTGQQQTFTLSAVDASPIDQAAPFTFLIDWDGDGATDETKTVVSGTQVDHTFATEGTFNVHVTAIDKDNGTSTQTTHTVVSDNLHIAQLQASSAFVFEGQSVQVNGTFASSAVGQATQVDINWGDGTTEHLTVAEGVFNFTGTHQYLDDSAAGTFTINVVVSNTAGSVTKSLPVTVANVAPVVASVSAATKVVPSQEAVYAVTVNDPGSGETVTAAVDWGDGTPIENVSAIVVNRIATLQASHAYQSAGTFTTHWAILDGDGGTTSWEQQVAVERAYLAPDPTRPGQTSLFVGASAGNDNVVLTQAANGAITIKIANLAFTTTLTPSAQGRLFVYTGAGNDIVQTGAATTRDAVVDAGADNDTVTGGKGHDTLTGGTGNDKLTGGPGTDTLVESGDVNFTLTRTKLTGLGTDVLATLEAAILTGGQGNNTINAASFSGGVKLYGLGGNDTLTGGALADTLDGGPGNDVLNGGAGNDSLTGALGDDKLTGATGTDTLVESADVDFTLSNTKLTGLGTDTLATIEAALLTGGAGNNVINAGAFTGAVKLFGGSGNDTLIGGSANDVLSGEDGNDNLQGGKGRDFVLGGQGDDSLTGDAGDDVLIHGTTTCNIQSAAFATLLAEWVRTDQTTVQRVNHLKLGGGKNGVNKLNTATVLDDLAADTLTGSADNDWFLAVLPMDTLTDRSATEKVN